MNQMTYIFNIPFIYKEALNCNTKGSYHNDNIIIPS